MPNDYKKQLLDKLDNRFGALKRLPGSQSLIELANGARIYLRYSKIHTNSVAFYGLRLVDLNQLDGHDSYICFYTDKEPPLLMPYGDFEAVIHQSPLASDGQYKAQLGFDASSRELYFPRVGRFNVDAYGGLESLERLSSQDNYLKASKLTHSQAQTLLAGIGHMKGYGVYVPTSNVETLDWSLTPVFNPLKTLPEYAGGLARFASEIDVLWVDHKQQKIAAAFEVEHSTPIYSGLLRFNDVLLTGASTKRFFIASNEGRRDLFARQLQRPTFQKSGLSELTSFLDYPNVYNWHDRLSIRNQ
ncbi:MAG: hypothetical protein HZC43_08020 [Nitrosomonadales bacterium]|nr:hypothetical protein [Nitrosomonadales bacterium]